MFLASLWKSSVFIGGRNPIFLSLGGSGEPLIWLMRHKALNVWMVWGEMKGKTQIWRPTCVSHFQALLFQLFRWIEASSQSFPNNNKGLTLSKHTEFLSPLVMPPKKGWKIQYGLFKQNSCVIHFSPAHRHQCLCGWGSVLKWAQNVGTDLRPCTSSQKEGCLPYSELRKWTQFLIRAF